MYQEFRDIILRVELVGVQSVGVGDLLLRKDWMHYSLLNLGNSTNPLSFPPFVLCKYGGDWRGGINYYHIFKIHRDLNFQSQGYCAST